MERGGRGGVYSALAESAAKRSRVRLTPCTLSRPNILQVGSVIGKGGQIVKTIREETNSKIRVCEGILQCEDRVIVIAAREDAGDDSEDSNAQATPAPNSTRDPPPPSLPQPPGGHPPVRERVIVVAAREDAETSRRTAMHKLAMPYHYNEKNIPALSPPM